MTEAIITGDYCNRFFHIYSVALILGRYDYTLYGYEFSGFFVDLCELALFVALVDRHVHR